MHFYDPKGSWGLDQGSRGHGTPQGDPEMDWLLQFGLVASLCLFLASFAPSALFPLVAARFLELAALGSSLEATLRGDRVFDDRLTAWDQAAALMAAGLLLRLLFGLPPELAAEGMPAGAAVP
ncbi:hypothetical protein [Roseomonas harenae]|uniref:hypothetical protein n=1 Tax=Muricoccus harenae TaxID=2692566 RepID=UPI001331387D|nr:hypothetical protein [Roseomonas harenae]